MARPDSSILNEYIDRKTYVSEQILESEAIWAVYYKEKPFNLRSKSVMSSKNDPKYKKTCFNSPAHAFRLAKRLNKTFNCNDFSVFKLIKGEKL